MFLKLLFDIFDYFLKILQLIKPSFYVIFVHVTYASYAEICILLYYFILMHIFFNFESVFNVYLCRHVLSKYQKHLIAFEHYGLYGLHLAKKYNNYK